MSKRVRTSHRFEEIYNIALTSHDRDWPWSETCQAIEVALQNNSDLLDDKAMQTARDEARTMSDRRLKGQLRGIYERAVTAMQAEPAGTKKRFNHVFVSMCRGALRGE